MDDENSFYSLCKRSVEKCLFCDKLFMNRYAALVHTAGHIIIPLLKQQLHQCPECLFHFSSLDDLNYHIHVKHSSVSIQGNSEAAIQVQGNKEPEKRTPDLLATFVPSKSVIKCEDLGYPSLEDSIGIVFEDDDDADIPLIQVDGQDEQPPKTLTEEPSTRAPEVIDYGLSIPYDDLMKPGSYKCLKCSLKFINKYDLVIHETCHMKFRSSKHNLCRVCERFIAGNYKNMNIHLSTKHPGIDKRQANLTKCRQCHLNYYNYNRHVRNYHEIYRCPSCGKGFENEPERDSHKAECTTKEWDPRNSRRWQSKMHRVCELCFAFFKNKINMQYVVIRDCSEMGTRRNCERCGHKFFELKLVKFWHLSRGEIDFKERKKLPLSNEDRLSKIQKRLKMLKMR